MLICPGAAGRRMTRERLLSKTIHEWKRLIVTAFRILLVILWTIIVVYTGIVISNHGWGLLEIFFRDMAAIGWPGQFNLDFTSLLALSALWVAWRHRFSGGGVA